MTIQQIVDKIIAYHPPMPDYDLNPNGCDHFKCGDPQQECTGILISCAASVEVLRKAVELGCNFVLVHEPSFYTHLDPKDWLEGDPVYEAKAKIIEEGNIVIYRDHDRIHRHDPDGIYYGIMKELGWEDYLIRSDYVGRHRPVHFRLPETTVGELSRYLIGKMHLNALRIIGDADAKVSTVSFIGHVPHETLEKQQIPTKLMREQSVDVVIPLESEDWTVLSYVRDAKQLGMNKAVLMPGHINTEELGMKWAVNWVKELVGEDIPVSFCPSADLYDYIMA